MLVRCYRSFGVGAVGADRELDQGLYVPVEIDGVPRGVALIDTGADCSLVDERMCRRLHRVGGGPAMTSAGLIQTSLYECEIGIFGRVFRTQVVGVPFEGSPFQVAIGRDVLRHGRLVYDGPSDTFSLTF